ncbi:hypothetical protein BYT27DRAFT_7254191 [Phlegmacium glaucopus]|nr:hypothetical protein BYT27DRAFT_7254191 [Phlegmacium glaucopus]
MSSNIVLPTLTAWTESHIAALYKATSPSGLADALNAFLAVDAEITVNGTKISRADFTNQIQSEKFDEVGAIVTFLGAVSAGKDQFEAGSVGVFFTATIQEAIRVRDAPVSSTVTSSVNVVIEQDPHIPVPPPSPIHGFFDRRRVKVFNQVFTDERVPFNIQVQS